MPVHSRADAVAFAALVRDLVRRHGGTRREAAEAAISGAEMVQNIVVHGGAVGEAKAWFDGDTLFLRAADQGPGMADPASLLEDGAERRTAPAPRGIGLGKGGAALVRLMDRVVVCPNAGRGLVVTACKEISWRRPPKR